MGAFYRVLAGLTGEAKRWAVANQGTIARWIAREGMPIWKVIIRINNMF